MSNFEFNRWLQKRLNVHGADLSVDGVIGRRTTLALRAFQRLRSLEQTGLACQQTVKSLRLDPKRNQIVSADDVPEKSMPPWLYELKRRMGLHERRDNTVLSKFLRIGKFLGDPARLPWCGDAVESAIIASLPDEAVPINPFFAQNWKNFGVDVGAPIVGAIGVIRWSASAGHVGIVVGYDKPRSRVYLLGGNQQNAVTIAGFDERKFIAFRWPETAPIEHFPSMRTGSLAQADYAATR